MGAVSRLRVTPSLARLLERRPDRCRGTCSVPRQPYAHAIGSAAVPRTWPITPLAAPVLAASVIRAAVGLIQLQALRNSRHSCASLDGQLA